MVKGIKIRIYGQVQGVFFRAEAMKIALSLNIVGYAQNLDGGTVEVVAEGEEENLKKFIDWTKHGPELAKVEKIDIEWNEPSGNFSDFRIE